MGEYFQVFDKNSLILICFCKFLRNKCYFYLVKVNYELILEYRVDFEIGQKMVIYISIIILKLSMYKIGNLVC